VHQQLVGSRKEDVATVFSQVVSRDRTRGSGHKWQYRKFRLNVRRDFFAVGVAQAVESPSLEIRRTQLDSGPSSLLRPSLL